MLGVLVENVLFGVVAIYGSTLYFLNSQDTGTVMLISSATAL